MFFHKVSTFNIWILVSCASSWFAYCCWWFVVVAAIVVVVVVLVLAFGLFILLLLLLYLSCCCCAFLCFLWFIVALVDICHLCLCFEWLSYLDYVSCFWCFIYLLSCAVSLVENRYWPFSRKCVRFVLDYVFLCWFLLFVLGFWVLFLPFVLLFGGGHFAV